MEGADHETLSYEMRLEEALEIVHECLALCFGEDEDRSFVNLLLALGSGAQCLETIGQCQHILCCVLYPRSRDRTIVNAVLLDASRDEWADDACATKIWMRLGQ